MNGDQRLASNTLWITIVNVDLQLYKGSIYKQRWGTPGGIDQALPCYDEAMTALDRAEWPAELRAQADDLRRRVSAYRGTLESKDVTTASAQHTRMLMAFDALRNAVRYWPDAVPAVDRNGSTASGGRLNMDEVVPNG